MYPAVSLHPCPVQSVLNQAKLAWAAVKLFRLPNPVFNSSKIHLDQLHVQAFLLQKNPPENRCEDNAFAVPPAYWRSQFSK